MYALEKKIYSRLSQIVKYIALCTYSIATIFFILTHMLATKRLQNELSRMFLRVFASIILDFQFLYLRCFKK